MNKVLVVLEKSVNNYSAYLPELKGCIVTGSTIQDTKEAIRASVEFHLEGMKEEELEIPDKFKGEFEFKYKLDVESLFEWFTGILTKSGVSRLTGLNQSLVSQYANGLKEPSTKQVKIIENAIHNFGSELLEIKL